MRLSIDRFEGAFAVCETPERKFMHIAVDELPPGLKEGDLIKLAEDGSITPLREETQVLREHIAARLKRLTQTAREEQE